MSEDAEQMALFAWLNVAKWRGHALREFAFHPANGGSRNAIEAVKLQRMGVLPGVPDVIVPVPAAPYCGLAVELKARGGRVTPKQREYLAKLRWLGWRAQVAFGADEAKTLITQYLAGTGHVVTIGSSRDPQIDWSQWTEEDSR